MNQIGIEQTLEELIKIFKGNEREVEVQVLNFYASKGFYFVCEDGKIASINYDEGK